jgi:regulator of sigma E protease
MLPKDSKLELDDATIEFTGDDDSVKGWHWPAFAAMLNRLPSGAQVTLTYERGNKETTTEPLTPVAAEGLYYPDRGLNFAMVRRTRTAATWGEAWTLGSTEAIRSLGMVYRFLGKLGTQVPITGLGGPVTIARAAGGSAFEGPGKLLLFLTMLSANLAVINFLPIPLLDGGHMAFLLWEGIRGKPAGEKFVNALHTVGFVFIITLMLFVLSLDFGWIPRNL